MASFDFAAVGDCVLRLSTGPQAQLARTRSLDVDVSGSEMNVACALAALGHKTAFAGALPDTKLGRRAAEPLRLAGVDTEQLLWRKAGRVSTYYVEYSPPPRGISVLYDRKDSCFDLLESSEIDWQALASSRIVHASGVTAALSERGLGLCCELLAAGREAGALASFDVNYRRLLWEPSAAAEAMSELLDLADICFCPLRDAQLLFGLEGDASDAAANLAGMTAGGRALVSDAAMGVSGFSEGSAVSVAAYPVAIVDRIGAGDGLVAGALHGVLCGDFAAGVRYGAAMAALAMGQRGEQLDLRAAELDAIVAEPRSGIVR